MAYHVDGYTIDLSEEGWLYIKWGPTYPPEDDNYFESVGDVEAWIDEQNKETKDE